jgi:hypothetical protein
MKHPSPDCESGKRRYATKATAQLAATNTGLPYVHKCRHCKGWHMTNQNPATRVVNGMTRTQKRRQVRKRAKLRQLGQQCGLPSEIER